MRKERTMNVRQTVFSQPDGGRPAPALPEPQTLEAIAQLEEICAVAFRALRRNVPGRQARDTAGALEYDSWLARDAGAVEYDSWLLNG
jgi:hypothetical protein